MNCGGDRRLRREAANSLVEQLDFGTWSSSATQSATTRRRSVCLGLMDASGDDEREARELPAAKRARGDGDGAAAAAVPAAVQQSPTGLLVTAAAAEAVAGKIVGRAMTTAAELDDQCRALAPEEVDAVCGRRVHLHLPYVAFGTCSTCCLLLSEGRALTPGPPPSLPPRLPGEGTCATSGGTLARSAQLQTQQQRRPGRSRRRAWELMPAMRRRLPQTSLRKRSVAGRTRAATRTTSSSARASATPFATASSAGWSCVHTSPSYFCTTTHSTGCLVGPGQTRELQVQPRL